MATRIEAEMLPMWGEAFQRGDTAAAERALNDAARLAETLAECCADEFHLRAVDSVRRAATTNRQLASGLAEAHRTYRDARTLYAQNRTADAVALFDEARSMFQTAGDVFAAKPWKYLAASYLYLGDAKRALSEIGSAIDFCAEERCGAVALSHLRWVEGMASGRSGDPQRALACYRAASRDFAQGLEHENAASTRALMAEELEFLGAGTDAWVVRKSALKTALQSGKLDRIYIAFTGAADAALHRGHLVSARMFQDVVVEAARREKNTVLLSDSLLWRGRVSAASTPEAAQRDLQEAAALALTVSDAQRQSRLVANIASVRADLESDGPAVDSLTKALRFYEATDDHFHMAELYARRAVREEKQSLSQLSEEDFLHSIRELESDRRRITDAPLRQSFFAEGSAVFDRVIRHLWMSGRRDDAFNLAEQSRGREMNAGSALPAVTLRSLSATLRGEDAVIEYALLDDRMIVWVIRSKGSIAIETSVTASKIAGAVAAMQEALAGDRGVEEAIAKVAALVYTPVAPSIRDARRLIIVANKALRAVPFGAFRDPTSRRYVIEDHEIAVAPSAAAYAYAVRRDRLLRHPGVQSILLASYLQGDPDRQLPRLDRGREEIDGLRGLYASVESVDDRQATPLRVLAAAGRASIVHIVAHAFENPEHPEYSSLVLAPATEGRDLYANTIATAAFRSTRLVFISSCGAARGTTHNDAPLTLPESFAAAGVPVVVGSLRPVDDAAAAAFAVAFHRAFVANGDAVTALQKAQLSCLASKSRCSVAFWSSWVAIGGTA